jgi:hypothetical protein
VHDATPDKNKKGDLGPLLLYLHPQIDINDSCISIRKPNDVPYRYTASDRKADLLLHTLASSLI